MKSRIIVISLIFCFCSVTGGAAVAGSITFTDEYELTRYLAITNGTDDKSFDNKSGSQKINLRKIDPNWSDGKPITKMVVSSSPSLEYDDSIIARDYSADSYDICSLIIFCTTYYKNDTRAAADIYGTYRAWIGLDNTAGATSEVNIMDVSASQHTPLSCSDSVYFGNSATLLAECDNENPYKNKRVITGGRISYQIVNPDFGSDQPFVRIQNYLEATLFCDGGDSGDTCSVDTTATVSGTLATTFSWEGAPYPTPEQRAGFGAYVSPTTNALQDSATFDIVNEILTIPVVEVGQDYYRVELQLIDATSLEFQVVGAALTGQIAPLGSATLNLVDNTLQIPIVDVGQGRYRLEMIVTDYSAGTLQLTLSEEL